MTGLPPRIKDTARWITPEPLNLAPALVGEPLAPPARRALAMGLDLGVVALLTSISGLWLLAGLAAVVLQLRNRPRSAPAGRRAWVGWAAAGVISLLALQEAQTQWDEWRHPAAAAVAAIGDASDAADINDASELKEARDAGLTAGPAASAAVAALDAALALAPASTAAAASGAASAPRITDAQRIARLQAELAEARKPKPLKLRQQLSRFLDDIGAGLGWGVVYFSLLPAWWGGQTVGKKFFGLRVVELTGKPMTVMRCLKRYGGYAAGMATGGLGFAQVLWDPNRQGLHDKAAHTAVLDLRVPRLVLIAAVPVPVAMPAPAPDQNA